MLSPHHRLVPMSATHRRRTGQSRRQRTAGALTAPQSRARPAARGRGARIFQIFYDAESEQALDPSFIPLDNTANPRPDWAEYWPIRSVLTHGALGEQELIGFFSPRFRMKTGLSGVDVLDAITAQDAAVYSFSPGFDQNALFTNPFEQGERYHAGLTAGVAALTHHLDMDVELDTLVCDHTTTIFANYWVARVSLWREWFELAERVFTLCEAGDTPLADMLNASAVHRGKSAYPMKVFVIERLITLLL